MPVTPKEALGNRTSQLTDQLMDLERRIDDALKTNFNGRDVVKVAVPHTLHSWVEDRLKTDYESKGWTVSFDRYSDYREDWSNVILRPEKPLI
jgi:hypothetical protein